MLYEVITNTFDMQPLTKPATASSKNIYPRITSYNVCYTKLLRSKDKNYILEMNITPQFRGMMNFVDIPEKIVV